VDHFEEHGEYRSAQEFLEADVVHGAGTGVEPAVEDEKTVKKKTAEAEASGAGSGTKQQPEKKAAPSSQAKKKPSTTTASEAKAPSPISAPPAADTVKTAEDVESDKEASGDDGGEAVETIAKASLFDLLNASSSDDSDAEDIEEVKGGDEKDAAAEELSSATALLRDLHMSRLARQPPPPPAAAATGGKKSKSKKKKAKTTCSSGNGSVAPVAAREDDEDDLAFLTRQADQTSRCGFQSTERRCKKSVVTLGAVCKHCNLKFCFDHAQPEVHGCGDAVRQAARQQFRTEATAKPSSTTKKLSADKRKLLQKKLGDKVNEQSASRQPKSKPNAKQ
jgi:hypothetical protein